MNQPAIKLSGEMKEINMKGVGVHVAEEPTATATPDPRDTEYYWVTVRTETRLRKIIGPFDSWAEAVEAAKARSAKEEEGVMCTPTNWSERQACRWFMEYVAEADKIDAEIRAIESKRMNDMKNWGQPNQHLEHLRWSSRAVRSHQEEAYEMMVAARDQRMPHQWID